MQRFASSKNYALLYWTMHTRHAISNVLGAKLNIPMSTFSLWKNLVANKPFYVLARKIGIAGHSGFLNGTHLTTIIILGHCTIPISTEQQTRIYRFPMWFTRKASINVYYCIGLWQCVILVAAELHQADVHTFHSTSVPDCIAAKLLNKFFGQQ